MTGGGQHRVLSGLYDKFAGLVRKLPGGLQKPILEELEPIRALFLERRAPRLVLAGTAESSVPGWLASMGVAEITTGDAVGGWRMYRCGGAGAGLWILDARSDVPAVHVRTALAAARPDLVWETGGDGGRADLGDAGAPVVPYAGGETAEALLERVCAVLPMEARLEFARATGARRAQSAIAAALLKSFSGVCGVVGLQPIPLADLPVLAALQSLMIGLIIHTSGRPLRKGLVAGFLGAMGVSVAAGFVFREAARAVVRIVPVWGNAVSGFVAAAGTYAIGKAAIVYFIDGLPLRDARRVFQALNKPGNPNAAP
jgi:uncharacterized protein (DUF697 family)